MGLTGRWYQKFWLLENLQMDSELTLEKAKKLARQKEAVKDQHRQLQQGTQRGAEALLEEVRLEEVSDKSFI